MSENRLTRLPWHVVHAPTSQYDVQDLRQKRFTLVIAHHDSILVRKLLHQLPSRDVIIIECPQSHWDFRLAACEEQLQPWLGLPALKDILLIGHSAGVPTRRSPTTSVSRVATRSTAGTDGSTTANNRPHWLERSSELQRGMRLAKRHFIERYDELLTTLSLIRDEQNHGIEITGLFYIAGSGIFSRYSPVSGDTEPLLVADPESASVG